MSGRRRHCRSVAIWWPVAGAGRRNTAKNGKTGGRIETRAANDPGMRGLLAVLAGNDVQAFPKWLRLGWGPLSLSLCSLLWFLEIAPPSGRAVERTICCYTGVLEGIAPGNVYSGCYHGTTAEQSPRKCVFGKPNLLLLKRLLDTTMVNNSVTVLLQLIFILRFDNETVRPMSVLSQGFQDYLLVQLRW